MNPPATLTARQVARFLGRKHRHIVRLVHDGLLAASVTIAVDGRQFIEVTPEALAAYLGRPVGAVEIACACGFDPPHPLPEPNGQVEPPLSLTEARDAAEKAWLECYLPRYHWNLAALSRASGVGRENLHRVVRKHGFVRTMGASDAS